jgi:hypothetical protein
MTLVSTEIMPNNSIISGVNYERRMLDIHSHVVDDISGLHSSETVLHITSQKSKRVKASTTLCQQPEILHK